MNNIAIIGTAGIPAKYGGFETLVEYLTRELGSKQKFTVYCSSKVYAIKKRTHNSSALTYFPLSANGIQSIIYDIVTMIHAAFFADVLLILGVSGCIFLPILRLFFHKKIIVNIDGLEWKRDKWNRFAKFFLKKSESLAVRFATDIITDNKKIQEYVLNEYQKHTILIAYGADHVIAEPITSSNLLKNPYLRSRYAFKVCRIEPENNLTMILEAFSTLDLNLVIIGNWDNSAYGRALREQYGNKENIFLMDPIYDQSLLNQFRSNCSIYIHGHSAGGTNPSLVEAMHLGLPVIAFDIGYNRETTMGKSLYFSSAKSLADTLASTPEHQWLNIGKELRVIAENNYRWDIIAAKYNGLFS